MDKVSFGFEDVSPEEKTERVGRVFANVARRYDLMNDFMSGGLHRHWKNMFVRRVKPRRGEQILDDVLVQAHPAAEHHPHHTVAIRAQRDPDAQFAAAPLDELRHGPVQTDGGQQRRDESECPD